MPAARKPRITKQLPFLLNFFKDMESRGQAFGAADIAKATGYPLKGSVKAKLSRKEWHPFLEDLGKGRYKARGTATLNIEEFAMRLSSAGRQLQNSPPFPKVKTDVDYLLESAAQEFQLAIELFNRPTTPNRVEAFVVHFIQAWEKLLKAKFLKRDGPDSIWEKGKERRSISLRVALDRLYPAMDKVRLNVEYVEDLRDDATHYMLPALDAIASRYFQSGVMNFFKEYSTVAGIAPIQFNGIGLMSLVFDGADHSKATLVQQYGAERAQRILDRIGKLEKAAEEMDDTAFAVPLHLSVGLVDQRKHPEHTFAGMAGLTPTVVTKTMDPKKSHPHDVNSIVAEVNKRLKSRFSETVLDKLLGKRGKPGFNKHDFSSISSAEGWKRDSNRFHFDHGTMVQHTYSDACIDLIVDKLSKSSEYLTRAKKKEVEKRKRK